MRTLNMKDIAEPALYYVRTLSEIVNNSAGFSSPEGANSHNSKDTLLLCATVAQFQSLYCFLPPFLCSQFLGDGKYVCDRFKVGIYAIR
jgi:hypothetical protein